jgi:hypothetical protein
VETHRVVRRRGSHIFFESRLTDGGEVVSLKRRLLFIPQEDSTRGKISPSLTYVTEGRERMTKNRESKGAIKEKEWIKLGNVVPELN